MSVVLYKREAPVVSFGFHLIISKFKCHAIRSEDIKSQKYPRLHPRDLRRRIGKTVQNWYVHINKTDYSMIVSPACVANIIMVTHFLHLLIGEYTVQMTLPCSYNCLLGPRIDTCSFKLLRNRQRKPTLLRENIGTLLSTNFVLFSSIRIQSSVYDLTPSAERK